MLKITPLQNITNVEVGPLYLVKTKDGKIFTSKFEKIGETLYADYDNAVSYALYDIQSVYRITDEGKKLSEEDVAMMKPGTAFVGIDGHTYYKAAPSSAQDSNYCFIDIRNGMIVHFSMIME